MVENVETINADVLRDGKAKDAQLEAVLILDTPCHMIGPTRGCTERNTSRNVGHGAGNLVSKPEFGTKLSQKQYTKQHINASEKSG